MNCTCVFGDPNDESWGYSVPPKTLREYRIAERAKCPANHIANAGKLVESQATERGMPKPYYERGGITIYHGDCRDLLPDIHADVIITDPPYNAKKKYGPGTNDNRPWPEWCEWWDDILDLLLTSAPDVLAFFSQTTWKNYVKYGRREIDWTLCWTKPLSLAVCAMPFMPHWEPIAYWGTTRKKDKAFWGSDVLTCNVEFGKSRFGHPTPKPVKLMRDLVSRFPKDAVILDPFAGSLTTLQAAKALGRQAIGIEIEQRFIDAGLPRLSQDLLMSTSIQEGQG